jgi:hypothetical protein
MNSSCFVADVAVSSGLVVWDEHRPKPGLSAHHAVAGSGWSQFRRPFPEKWLGAMLLTTRRPLRPFPEDTSQRNT